jgi:hypothetical protein
MKRKLQEYLNLFRIFGVVCLLILVVCTSCVTQKEYQVQSMYSLPLSDISLIRVIELYHHKNKVLTIVSKDIGKAETQGEQLHIDSIYFLRLTRLHSNSLENELLIGIRGDQVLYIDGKKVYDPDEELFSAKCLDGVYLIYNCK